jgi:hypothetical protein
VSATTYDYDVAISFLIADQPLAPQVREALVPLRVFVYSNEGAGRSATVRLAAARTANICVIARK